jgi:hypothetical protein
MTEELPQQPAEASQKALIDPKTLAFIERSLRAAPQLKIEVPESTDPDQAQSQDTHENPEPEQSL